MKKPGSGVSAKACPASALAALAAASSSSRQRSRWPAALQACLPGPDVAPAFGDPYQEAEEAVRAHADDAALLGVRTDGNVALDEQRPWVYLFGSKRTGYSYSVPNDRRERRRGRVRPALADAKPMGRHREAGRRFGGGPPGRRRSRGGVGKAPTSYNASLVTFEDTSGRAGLKPMVWYVGLGRPDGRRRGQHGTLRSGGALEALAPTTPRFAAGVLRTRGQANKGRAPAPGASAVRPTGSRSSWGRRPGRARGRGARTAGRRRSC